MTIGEKVKKLRTLRGLSTVELAKMSGVHQTTISAIENGRHSSPGLDTIEHLAKALRISPLYFFDDRVQTPFDLIEDLPSEISEFLLREESLPYLSLSKKAYDNGISSKTIEQLLKVLQENHNEKGLKVNAGQTRGEKTRSRAQGKGNSK